MQQLNTNQAESSALCKTIRNKCLNFTFSGNHVNISTARSSFQYNLNQGTIQLWWAFVNMGLTFLSLWQGLQWLQCRLIRRGDELPVMSSLPAHLMGFNSVQALGSALSPWLSIWETGMTLILGLDGSEPQQQQSCILACRGGVGKWFFLAAERQKRSY